ncbi:Transmembrane_domain-containing protein [Hexamita inflata]|uniref:Transmembrane domain-containing protein n=1 Tax=Hexamita inflata TaxID=28002 RepID=A0AA86NRI7_9EUKA|nr:Transmembrane domain-containing protein [Hexamita inflata]
MIVPTSKTVYDYRQWPLYTKYSKLFEKFGYDAMAYQPMLFHMFIYFIFVFLASFLIWIAYMVDDKLSYNPIANNINSFFSFVPISNLRGIVWFTVLMFTIFFARFIGYQRKYYEYETGQKESVENYTVVIQNIPDTVGDNDIKEKIDEIFDSDQIVRYMRVMQPQSLKARRSLLDTKKEYNDVLLEFGENENSGTGYKILKYTMLLKFVQMFGYWRDVTYYNNKIKQLELKVDKQNQLKSKFDAAIVTMNTTEQAQKLIHKVNSNEFTTVKLHAIQAPPPDDIYMENLGYNPIENSFRYFISMTIVVFTSIIVFGLVCVFRYQSRDTAYGKDLFFTEQVKYYAIFLCTYITDWVFRPALYLAQSIEKHNSFRSREKAWMKKLYLYQVLNKLAVFYSRTCIELLQGEVSSFFEIYGFTTQWRTTSNSGGHDAIFYVTLVVFGYNVLDCIIFLFYWVFFRIIAVTQRDKIRAMKSLPIRYASKYVYLLLVITFILCFAHVQPIISLIILGYFPIQSLVNRWILLRISSQNIKTCCLVKEFENFIYFAVILSGACLCQSYAQLGNGLLWFFICLPILGITVFFVKQGMFDYLVKRADDSFRIILQYNNNKLNNKQIQFNQTDQWYEEYKAVVTEDEVSALRDSQLQMSVNQMSKSSRHVNNDKSIFLDDNE